MYAFKRQCLLLAAIVLSPTLVFAFEGPAQKKESSQEEESSQENEEPQMAGFPIREIPEQWQTLYKPAGKRALLHFARRFRLDRPCPLKFQGPGEGPNSIHKWSAGGAFSITGKGILASPKDHMAALHLGTAQDFHLQTAMKADGTGATFVLFGWTGQSGYLLHQLDMRSFSKWGLMKYVQDEDKFVKIENLSRYRWKDWKPFEMQVRKGTLTVRVGQGFICQNVKLTDYTPGQIFLGTALSRYGPKHLKIRAMRIRSLDQ